LKIKSQAIDSSTDVAIMILRIDDVISSKDKNLGKIGMNGGRNSVDSYGEY